MRPLHQHLQPARVPAPQLKPLGLQAQSQNKRKVPFSCTGYKIEDFLEPSWGTVYKLETAEKANPWESSRNHIVSSQRQVLVQEVTLESYSFWKIRV